MADLIDAAVETLRTRGWDIALRDAPRFGPLPEAVAKHAHVPRSYELFLRRLDHGVCGDGLAWFWTWEDFLRPRTENEQWDFELQAFDSPKSREHWRRHLLFMHSVWSDYAYMAIVTDGTGCGRVVDSWEPDAEETFPVTGSFDDFLRLISIPGVRLVSFFELEDPE